MVEKTIPQPVDEVVHLDERALLTSEWYAVPLSVDCAECGAQSRLFAIVVGPSSMTHRAGLELDDEMLEQPWQRMETFGLVERFAGRTENVERYIVGRYQGAFRCDNDGLKPICEHCDEVVEPVVFRVAAMESFVRLGQSRLLANERSLIFGSNVELMQFHGGTWIEDSEIEDAGYSLLLVCDVEDRNGMGGVVEIWHSIARSDYAMAVKGIEGTEVLRQGFGSGKSKGLERIVADVTSLGLVFTELREAQEDSPYCRLAHSLFLEALESAGYRKDD